MSNIEVLLQGGPYCGYVCDADEDSILLKITVDGGDPIFYSRVNESEFKYDDSYRIATMEDIIETRDD